MFSLNAVRMLECLFLLGKKSLYIIDGYQQRTNGEVVDSADVPVEVCTWNLPFPVLLSGHAD